MSAIKATNAFKCFWRTGPSSPLLAQRMRMSLAVWEALMLQMTAPSSSLTREKERFNNGNTSPRSESCVLEGAGVYGRLSSEVSGGVLSTITSSRPR